VQPAEITRAEVDFRIEWGRSNDPLESGLTYEFGNPLSLYANTLFYVEDRQVCAGVDAALTQGALDYSMTSSTPDVCPILEDSAQQADLIAPGVCELTLSAPDAGVAGFEESLSVVFEVPSE
jgi:hypothetical protein